MHLNVVILCLSRHTAMGDTTKIPTFQVADYVVFSLCMMVTAFIGIYYRFSGGRQRTTKEFLMGGKKLNAIPVAFSLQASGFF